MNRNNNTVESDDEAIEEATSWHSNYLNFWTLHNLSPSTKRLVLKVNDAALLFIALYAAFVLRYGTLGNGYFNSMPVLFTLVPIVGVIFLWLVGFYNILIRAFDFRTARILTIGTVATALLIMIISFLDTSITVPRSVPIIFMLLAYIFIGSSRLFFRWIYIYSLTTSTAKEHVVIYGIDRKSSAIASILGESTEFELVGFIEDDPVVQGNYLRGKKVYETSHIKNLANRFGKIRVIISISDMSLDDRRTLINRIHAPNVEISLLQSFDNVISGRSKFEGIRPVRIEELLGRKPIEPIKQFFSAAMENKVVMITGAGGSIGSEICRQIIKTNPKRIVAIDNSELAIYNLQNELSHLLQDDPLLIDVQYYLGSIMDRQTIARILTETKPDIVYHVAAYKHVPIMEKNILQAIKNNIIGTRIVAEECIKGDIERCVLVSTDKAVRPTNVMGATKRVAELILQALANTESNTIFSIVRFGNVLGSSGSVIPLFTKQIKSGGPVTVTDPEVTRFFMTIQEAAQLVIQAGVLAKSGDVFVLDMGDPINISEVAEILIKLSGLKVRNADEPNGDIEIVYTGLRSGEKLHEELHISNIVEETPHPKIFAAQEKSISHKQMMKYFKRFDVAVDNADVEEIVKILYELVEGLELKFSDQPN